MGRNKRGRPAKDTDTKAPARSTRPDAAMHRPAATLAALILIAMAAIIVYSNTFRVPFHFDDIYAIKRQSVIRSLDNFDSPGEIIQNRTIPRLTFAINYRLDGFNVFGYHLVNLVIHVVNGWIVFFMVLRLLRLAAFFEGRRITAAAAAGLIFVCHPLQTQAVTYICQRITSLAALFYLLAVLLYVKARDGYRQRHRAAEPSSATSSRIRLQRSSVHPLFTRITHATGTALRFGPAALCGLLAMCSKDNAASLPGAILLTEYVLYGGTQRDWRRKLPWTIAGFVLWGLIVLTVRGVLTSGLDTTAITERLADMSGESGTAGRWRYLCTQFTVLWVYLRLLVLPVNQCVDYYYPFVSGFTGWPTPLAFGALLALMGGVVLLRKKHPLVMFGVLWLFITLSVESSVIPIKDTLVEYRLYLPMFGFALLASYTLFSLSLRKTAVPVVIFTLLITALGAATFVRNTVYRNEMTLWTDVVAKRPDNPRGHYNLGRVLHLAGRLEEAITHYRQTVDKQPTHRAALSNMGIALSSLQRHDEAIAAHRRASEVGSYDPAIHYNLGTALDEAERREEAVAAYREAISLKPDYTDAHFNCGNSYAGLHMTAEARACYERAARFAYRDQRYEDAIRFADQAREAGTVFDRIFLDLLDKHQ